MVKSKKGMFGFMLSLCLVAQLTGCTGSSASGNKDEAADRMGDSFLGYLDFPKGWVDVSVSNESAREASSSNSLAAERRNAQYNESSNSSCIRINVSIDTGIDEMLYSVKQGALDFGGVDFSEALVSLDSGLLDTVYRIRCTVLSYDGEIAGYLTQYVFTGFDGLVRTISITTLTEELMLEAESIVDSTYTFDCDPSSQQTIIISSVDKQVILDDEGVVITLLGYYEGSLYGSKVSFMVENNSQESIFVGTSQLMINGSYQSDTVIVCPWPIASGETRVFYNYLDSSTLTDESIDNIDTIEFEIYFDNGNTDQEFTSNTVELTLISPF